MASTEERLARLEGQVQEQSQGFPELRDSIGRLELRLDTRILNLERRFDARLESLDAKVSRHFVIVVGMMVTLLVTIIGGFATTFLAR
jgi:hypothetical protein